jgi:K+-sensing histidine kinase KdpD
MVPNASLPFRQAQVLALACLVSAFALRVILQPVLENREIFLTFFPAVLIASFWGGFWSGATTLCVGALLGDFFWLRHMENLHWPLFGLQFLLGYLVTGTMILVAAMVFQRVLAAHRASETEARLLAREMRHRLRNVLGLVTAISRQTARRSKTIDEYEDHFESRMDALGAALAVNSAE